MTGHRIRCFRNFVPDLDNDCHLIDLSVVGCCSHGFDELSGQWVVPVAGRYNHDRVYGFHWDECQLSDAFPATLQVYHPFHIACLYGGHHLLSCSDIGDG